MESYINTTGQSLNESFDDINFDVPLFATYLNMIFLLVAIFAIIIPSVLVIRIILTTEKLHTIYYLFVIHLLATDILNTLKMGFQIILMCLYLYGINADTIVNFVIYAILSIPQPAARLSFITLAIDRLVAVAFPYRHKSIMTYKRAYVMLMVTWILSCIECTVFHLPYSFIFVWSLAVYIPLERSIGRLIFIMFLFLSSVILIVCVNVYLYIQVNKSKQKLEENMATHGTHCHNIKHQFNRRLHKFRKQVKTTLSLLVLGGVDGIINLLTIMVVIVMNRVLSMSNTIYTAQFVGFPLIYIQMMSHSLVYGIYMKDIRRRLCSNMCYLYQRLKRAFPLRPSKVIVLNQSN